MLTKTQILSRENWTRRMIDKYLGEPDNKKKVRGQKNMICYFDEERVYKVEKSAEFVSEIDSNSKRKKAACKSVTTKRINLIKAIEQMKITIEMIPHDELLNLSIEAYNLRNTYKSACHSDQPDFIFRIVVNYIRHNLTQYDETINEMVGKVGKSEALQKLREKIYLSISETYPEFSSECDRQLRERS